MPEPTIQSPPAAAPRLRPRWVRALRRAAVALLILLAAAALAFVLWATIIPAPMPEAIAALESDSAITVTPGNPIAFAPASGSPRCGFIFYPGGRVDARAYAPALREIAGAGYLVLAPSMPMNLAVFAPNRATGLIAAHPEIAHWAIGGHSLGGAMAASFAATHPVRADGLALWASFPAASSSLAAAPIAAATIYGTRDGVAPVERIEASFPLLPPVTARVPIEGGNHAQFGWYGDQRGDNPATISRSDQQRQTVDATLALLDSVCR